MENFITIIKKNKGHEIDKIEIEKLEWPDELSFLEKALLYYYSAATYFEYSTNMKEAFFCYKKILYVFQTYLEVSEDSKSKKEISIYLKDIKEYFIGHVIQNLYIQYENTNMVEIGILKDIFDKGVYQHIPLNLLSAFPDLEEFMILYCRLELLCELHKEEGENKGGSLTAQLYRSMSMSPYRMASTITERILALRFKANIDIKILNELLDSGRDIKTINYDDDFLIQFYEKYSKFLTEEDVSLGGYRFFFQKEDTGIKDFNARKDLVEFLIIDAKFALSKIIETISPTTQTTLFSENFMGGVYMKLYECNQIFDLIHLVYELFDEINAGNRSKAKDIINRIWSFYVARIKNENGKKKAGKLMKIIGESYVNQTEIVENSSIWGFYKKEIKENEKLICKLIITIQKVYYEKDNKKDELIKIVEKAYEESDKKDEKWNFYIKYIEEIDKQNDNAKALIESLEKICKKIEGENENNKNEDEGKEKYSEKLSRYRDNHIDYADHHNNITNYLHEMALRKYKRAIEMHHEGGAYQELLNSMYFLEDNLNNNTYQFNFAIERYYNNCGILDEREKRLKDICNNSALLEVDRYIKEACKWPE